jgi:hypothetical protein
MATASEFRLELYRRFQEDTAAGQRSVVVVSRELHDVGQRLNPTRTTRFPNVCGVMRQEQRLGVDEVVSPRASDGPNFAIRYRLPR